MPCMATAPTPLIRTKTAEQQLMEHRLGVSDLADELRRLYVTEGLRQEDIAARWSKDQATISRWLARFGISRRA